MIEFLTELSKLAGQRAMHYFGKISSSDIECKAAKDLSPLQIKRWKS